MTIPKVATQSKGGSRFYVDEATGERQPGVTSIINVFAAVITGLFQRMRRENDAAHGAAIAKLDDIAETVHEIDEQLDDMAEWQEKPSEQGDFGTPPGRRDHFQYSSTERGEPPPAGAGGSSPEQET